MPVISIEGVNGAGKTTLLSNLRSTLPADALIIRSPGGTPAGEKIRKTVNAALAGENAVSPSELAHLNVQGFALSMAELIEPALSDNPSRLVLLDRWSESTHAYQGAQGVAAAYIDNLLKSIDCLKPNLTILLDIDVRMAQNRHTTDGVMGGAEVAFKKRVREIYLERAAQSPTIIVIDASDPPEIVFRKVRDQLADALTVEAQNADIS